jgi:AcrR family transcriptional regulator
MNAKSRTRHTAQDRKTLILDSALLLSEQLGYKNVSCLQLAETCGCGHSLILHHFINMANLRDEIMRRAVAEGNLVILAQGLVNKDPIASLAPDNLKRRALNLKNM